MAIETFSNDGGQEGEGEDIDNVLSLTVGTSSRPTTAGIGSNSKTTSQWKVPWLPCPSWTLGASGCQRHQPHQHKPTVARITLRCPSAGSLKNR